MKRIKNEHIRAVVGQYLKRRHFSDNIESSPQKDGMHLNTQCARQMALKEAVLNEGALSNVISYSSISGDATACDQQYTRLKAFILDSVESYKAELQQILFPLFVHVYMELLGNGHKTPAQKFLARHAAMFTEQAACCQVLEVLQRMTCREDLIVHETTTQLRENRCVVPMSEEALHYLLTYLRSDDNILMLQIFNNHFELQVHTMSNTEDTEADSSTFEQHIPPPSPPLTPEVKAMPSEVTLGTLSDCIKRVKSGPPCPTSVCFYTFLNAYQGLSAVALCPQQTLLAGGFEDSSIQLWNLTPKPMPSEPTEVSLTHINLSGDFIEDVLERRKKPEGQEMRTLRGHSGTVYGTAFTPDMRFLLSSSEDTTVRLWDLKTHTNLAIYAGHNYPVWDVDTSVDGFFASCSHDRTAKLWVTDRIYPLRSLVGHVQDVDCVRFHPNSNYLATGSADKTVRLWSIKDGCSVRLFQGHRAGIFALAFSPDGKFLASAGEDRRIKIWDLNSGSLLKDLRGHTDTIYSLSFNNDSTMLASGGLDSSVRIWDVRKTPSAGTASADGLSCGEQLATFPTKSTTVHYVNYVKCNLLYAAGAATT